jgi:hypothetical protein
MVWITNPVMAYLLELGIMPMVYDSWTSATSSEILKPWAQRIRNAIYAQSDTLGVIEPALKLTYAATNGLFNAPGGSIYRPDWHWTDVDLATVNARRKLDRVKQSIGVWPCEIYHDAVWYPVEDAQAFADLNLALGVKLHPERTNIGKFKYQGWTSVEAWQARQDKRMEARTHVGGAV